VSNAPMETIETNTIHIVVNGAPKRVPAGLTVASLLSLLEIDGGKVAVELNRAIIRKKDWAATMVEPDAVIEVVWFVGGGRE
jgi:thiamine biosynthesis protein ThiS